MRTAKRLLSLFTAAAIAMSTFVSYIAPASAAGETTVLYERGYETAWTADDLASFTQSGGNALALDATYNAPVISGSNGSHSATMTIAPAENALLEIDAVVYLDSDTGRKYADNNYSYFKFGNIYVAQNDQDKASAVSTDGMATYATFGASGVSYRAAWESLTPHTIHMEIDTSSNTLKTLTVNGEAKATDVALSNADYTTLAFGYQRAKSVGTTQTEALKSIKISQTTQVVEKANYTVNYVTEDGTTVKTETAEGVVGLVPVISMDMFNDENNQRYICESNDLGEKTITEGLVVNVTCHAAATYEMKVVPSTDETVTLASANVLEGDTYTYNYPLYLTDAQGKVVAKTTATTYGVTVTPTKSETITVGYEAYEGTAYFADVEKVLSGTAVSDNRLSSAGAVRSITNPGSVITIPENGTYTVTVRGCSNNVNAERTWFIYKDGTEDANLVTSFAVTQSINYLSEFTAENVELKAGSEIYVKGSDSNVIMDYILVTKTAASDSTTALVKTKVTGSGTITPSVTEASAGDTVTFTATPAEGYKLVGDVTVTAADGTAVTVTEGAFTMPASYVTISATFEEIVKYDVTVNEEITNGTATTDVAKAEAGATVTITATPAEGYRVASYEVKAADDTAVEVTGNTFVMPEQAVTVSVIFEVIPKYAITVDTATVNGTVAADVAEAAEGATVTVTATPADGYEARAIKVTGEDGASVKVTNGTFTMPAQAVTVTATFKEPVSDEEMSVSATLVHTAAAQGGSNDALTTLDTESHYINNWGTTSWAGTGYTEFSFEDTDVWSGTAARIKSITLTFQTNCAGSRDGRNLDVALLDEAATAGMNFENEIPMIAKPATIVASYNDIVRTYTTKTVDVTDYLKDRIANGETRFIFAYSNANAGGNIYGKGSATGAPTLTVELFDGSVVPTTYTINYVDAENNVLKEARTDDCNAGDTVSAIDTDLVTFIADGEKYVYASGNDAITAVADASANVINLVFNKLAKYNVTVKAVDSATEAELGTVYTGIGYAGEDAKYSYPAYYRTESGAYYKAEATTYSGTVSAISADAVETVKYTLDDSVAAFMEGEAASATSTNVVINAYESEAFSNGKGASIMQSSIQALTFTFNAPVAGTYTLSAPLYNNNGSARKYDVYVDDFNADTRVTLGLGEVAANASGSFSYDVELTAGEHTIYYALNYSLTPAIDYLLVDLKEAAVAPTTYAVTVAEATNGTVTVDKATAAEGETVTITATATEGYEVDTITVTDADGAAVTVENNAFTMPAKAVTVTVTFKEGSTVVEPTTYAVTVAATENGTVTVDKATAEEGATVTITATANDGFAVDTIIVTDADGAAVTVANNAFVMPAKAVTVTVTFKSTEAPVDPTAVIDFTNRTLTYEAKGSSTVFEVTDAATAGATALAAAGAKNVLRLGSSANGAAKYLGYEADFAKEGANTVVYGGKTTMSFKLEPMQVRTDKEASIELAFADINGNKILPITVATGATPGLTVNGTAATGIAYGNYYVVTYTMDFAAGTASVKIDAADGTNCLNIENVAITATNLTQLYRANSDWLYGYCAIDDIAIDAEEIGVPVFYTIVINAERYAKLTTSDNAVYYADVNGKIEIPLQKPGTTFDYTLSKVGYDSVTGTVPALEGDFEDSKTMTKSNEDIIFIESEFGNANEAYVSAAGSRNDSISLGSIALPEMSEITVDLNFAGIASESGSHKTWALVSDGGAMVGIQFNLDGIYAWTGWTGSTNWNQSSDVGTYSVSERLGDLTTGDLTFKFVVDTTNKAVTVSYGDVSKSLTYAVEATALTSIQTGLYRSSGETKFNEIKVQLPDPNYLSINGVSGFAKVSGQTVERTYGLSQTVIIPDETFTWTVADAEGNAIEGVTIENGVLKVADTATPGTAVITCVGSSSAEKVATFNVTIGDFQQVTLVIDGPQSYDVTDTSGQYTVVSAVDSFGDEVKDVVPAVVWTSSDDTVVSVDAATGAATVVGAGSATITATITNGTAVSTATIPVTVDTYYIVAEATGDSTVVDITNLVDNAAITGYQVTTIKDGAIVNQTVVAKADVTGGTTTTTAKAAGEKIVATYDANGAITGITSTAVAEGDVVDLTAAENTKVFLWNSLNGMAPVAVETVVENKTITVDTTGATSVEVAPVYQTTVGTLLAIPAATYNITVTANNGARTDVYANEQMLINNLNQGSDNWTVGRVIAASTDYEVEDIVIDQGYVKFKMYDDKSNGSTITKVVFAKVPDGVTRAKRIYTIGDSLVAAYYGEAPEGQEGLVRTGWGQVFDLFVKDEVGVTNLGNSGAEAVGMLGAAFTNVKESAKAGDIVIWESGYNDRTYSTVENMKAAITEAYEYCVANGIEFYVVNPNASSHDYNASVVWASHIRDLATETGMPLIDLSQKSYDFLNGMYAEVEDVHTLLRTYYNNTGDTLHSSYNAANCWAAIVAQGLYDAGKTDIIDTEYSYTFNDGIQDVTVQVVETPAEETPAE